MLAQVLAMGPYPSIIRLYSFRMPAPIELVFWLTAFHQLMLMLCCILGKVEYLQNYGYSVWNFVPNSGFRRFGHRMSAITEYDINNWHHCYYNAWQ